MKTARRPHLKRVSLREDVVPTTGPLSVDREARVIKGVKVLGLDSANGRRYAPEAVRDAARLYEGCKVYCDHPPRPEQTREVDRLLGRLVNVRIVPDGLRADLQYLASHPQAERVCEDAERALGLFGLSHNADGRGDDEGGTFVVREITEVRSVDLVTDAATVKNLWESRQVTTTLRQLIESSKQLPPLVRAALLEAGDDATLDAPMADMPPAPADTGNGGGPAGDPKALLAQAVAALVQSDDPDDHALAQKIMKILKPESGGGGGGDKSTSEGEGDGKGDSEPDADDKGKDKKDKMSEARVKALCKLAAIEPTAEVLTAVVGLSEERAVATLGLLKAARPAQPAKATPRSSLARPLVEGTYTPPATAEEQAKRLLR